jgi:predicted nucleic acid-binding protein
VPYLIDSDVIIWALRGRSEIVEILLNLSEEESIACSAINVLEVEVGAKPSEMKAVHQHLGSYEILPVLPSTARKAAEILRSSSRKPHRGKWADAVIAATALLNDLTLVTFNTRHYQYPGLSLYPMKDLRDLYT